MMSYNSYSASGSPRSAPMQIRTISPTSASPCYTPTSVQATTTRRVSVDTRIPSAPRRDSVSSPVSWQFNSAMTHRRDSSSVDRRPSAYISDADLWGVDAEEVPVLREAPSPPRSAEQWLAQPILPPTSPSPRRRMNSSPNKKLRFDSRAKK